MNKPEYTIDQLEKDLLSLKQANMSLKIALENAALENENAVNALKESENRFLNLFEFELVNYQSLDSNGCLTEVNPTWLKTLGFSQEEVIGHNFSEFMTPESADLLNNVLLSASEKNIIRDFEFELIQKSGAHIYVNFEGKILTDDKGNFKKIQSIWTDITSRKQAELLKAENEISYRELFNNVADAVYIQDKEGTFLDVNEGAVKMYGYPREVLIGKNPIFVAAPGKNDFATISNMIDLAYSGEPQQFEFWGLRSNGEIFLKEVRIINGTYFGKKVLIAMAHDITNRKQAEIALQDSERRYRELIELAVDGILLGSPDGIIIGANTYMQKLTGRSLDKLIGIKINELFSYNALKNTPLRYDLLRKGETVFSERDILRPDGTTIPIEMHTKMMPDGSYQSIYRDVTERKRAEETLRESEIKFKSLVESTSDMIWETSIEGKFTYVSPQFENLLGYTPADAIGKSPFDFIEDENMSGIISQSDSIVNAAIPFSSFINRYKHRNGETLYFETSGVPVQDNQGKLIGYRGISRDVTKRHITEKELHKLSLVVHQSPNTIIITDLEGQIEYINPAGCALTGYNFEELIGKTPSVFKSGVTPDEEYKSLWNTIKAGNEWKGIFQNKKKNGDYFWERAFVVPLRNAEGIITNYLGVKEDISKRIHTEEALKESEKRYRSLFEASPDAIILADIETGMLIDANMAACDMLGLSLDEIKQLHQSMIHPARYLDFSLESFNEHAEKALAIEALNPIESVILRSDGSEIPVEVMSSKITINGRHILQGVFRNITERKLVQEEIMKAKEKAEAGDKLKSAFLQNISHELRTPLNGIIGFSEMITQMDSTEEDRLEFSKMIKKSSTRLINTITSYMDISMIVSGLTEINERPFRINKFLEKINDKTIELCKLRNQLLQVTRSFPETDIQIITDEGLLDKVFTHLIDNALKFTDTGSISIGYEYKPGFHQFSISDTGRGISDESLSAIFEVFRQADSSTSRGYEGSGLGLSIARGFIKLLGGDIWVESKINEGSTFFFTIPEKATTSTPASESTSAKSNSQKTQPVILVAEDDDSNYKYLEIVLKKASFKVLRATNGFDTVEICRSHPEISILLTDLKMPGMDGFEATRQIKKILPNLPIIVLSAFVSSIDENVALAAGCNAYIVKPVSKGTLLETIGKFLKLPVN
jgi:PAS domain S-box-containing protein